MKILKNVKFWCIGVLAIVMIAFIGVGSWLLVKEHRLNEIQQSALEQLDELDGEYDTNKIVLNNTSYSKANALATQFNATLRITSDGKFATLTLPEGVTVRDVYSQRANRQYLPDLSLDNYSRVSEDESTEHIASSPNYTVTDTYYSVQSYINYLNIGNAWTNYKGNNVTVAVIDTGIDYNHTEFSGKISEYSYNATEDKIVKDYTLDDGDYDWSLIEDDQGHGTAVAGVIAASMDGVGTVGIAPNVSLLVIKAECDVKGNFYNTSDLVFGLYYAIERDVDIVNMSFGTYGTNPFASAAKLAVDSDIICVAAAGNDGTTSLCYPAADANVIGVGALAQDSWELASYSNYGENIDIVAPGTVYTTKTGGGYGVMNGTSFASPIVAAAVALYRQQNKYCEFTNVQEMLYASSYDLGSLGNDWYYGYGALDISALICEERGTVTFNMLTDELENTTQIFIRNHTLQNLPEPERTYAVFDGWYYDIHCMEEVEWYADIWSSDLTLYANWVNEDDGVPYTYVTLPDNTIEIRSYTGKRRYITIPEMIEGKVVSSIGEFAFDGQTRLREVNLPSGLTNIGAYAFRNCNNLLSITIPEGVTALGEYAFYNTVRLSSVGLEGNSKLQTVGQFAFAYSGLSRFELPANLKSIDGSAFFGANSLKSITVNKGNTSFQAENGVLFNNTGSALVAYPAGLSGEYTLPDTVRTIGSYAFGYTKSAVELNAVTTISAYAFEYASLSEIILPDSVTSLGTYAFAYNFNLSEVTLGRGIKSIPESAFYFCSALREIEIPAQIVSIGSYAFAYTYTLNAVTFASGSNLTSIGGNAFTYSALQSITIPDSVLTIGSGAFAKCYMLSQVIIGENSSLQVIGASAFSQDISLDAIYLPVNLMQIGGYAFMGTGLQTVTLPSSLTYLGAGAFASCHSLTAINVESGNAVYVSVDGVVYNADKTVIVAYPAGNEATTYTIESTVTEIGEAAFYGSYNLNSVVLPNGLVTVSSYGFYDCEHILSYSLPETLTYIEAYAFSYNTALTSLKIPDNVYQISNYAFAYDYNLRTITFNETSKLPRISYGAFAYTGITSFRVPASVSTIAQGAFAGCSNLTQITFAANSKLESVSAYMFDGCTNLKTVTFESGSALTSIQAHAFEGLTKLQTVNFGDAKLTNIDNYAFRFCASLTTLSIPDGVTYIGRFAFYGASSLTRLDLPESIDYIGRYAFYGASNLNIYFAAETLPDNLQENWDNGIAGYYVGVTDVATDGDWQYAVLKSGGISIIKYTGTETKLDLTTLDFGGNIVSIGGYAFYFSGITSIILPDTLTTISAYAFARSNLTSITIPASVEYIAQNAFFYTPLTSVTFEENSNLTKIEQYAFAYTRSLQSVALPASLSEMGSYAFYQSGITVLNFEDGIALTEIPQYAFASTKITSVVLPDSVTLLNHNAFRDCTYLQTVTYGNNDETYLMSNVFYNTGLTTVVIPSNVTYIGEYALVGLEYLTAFEVDENNAYYSSIDGLLYNKDGSKLIAVPAGKTGSIFLPESLEVIGYGAFENTSLDEISFNENSNILTFGYRAFYGAKNLTSITIPASVVIIDYYAFAMCENLTSVTFAEGSKLTGVYEGAFYGCRSLKDILLPDSIVEISDFAFYGCSSLTKLPISDTSELKGIYQYAFAYTGITNLTVPETVIDIGEYAFRGAQLVSVIIPDTNAKQLIIGIGAFAECENLVEITLPFIGASYEDDEITWFGYIFGAGGYVANSTYVPESLKSVTITEGITFVGKYAFYNLTSLETINVPHSVSMLYTYVFYGTTAKYELTNTIYLDSVYAYSLYFGKGISGNLALGEGVTSIGSNAFWGCSSLVSIEIPDSVTSIGTWAFEGCSSLVSIEIPDSVTSIGTWAFKGCSSLTNIEIPSGVTSIGNYAFEGCSSLTSIEIPAGVTSIGHAAFYNCSRLYQVINNSDLVLTIGSSNNGDVAYYAKVIIDKNGDKTYLDETSGFEYIDTVDGFRFMVENGEYKLIAYLGLEDTVTLPENIKGNTYTIYRMLGVKNVIIPDSFTTINDYAFYGCSSLTSIEIPDSVTSIGSCAFSGCSSLTSVMFGENSQLTSIGNYAFSSCSSLTSIIIPDSVTSIGDSAFYNCRGLTSVTFGENSQLTSIGNQAFLGCSSLVSIEIPAGVTSIGDYAFFNCSSLTSIEIPSGVTSIGTNAFSGCTKLNLSISNENESFTIIDGVLYNKAVTQIIYVFDSVTSIVIPATVTGISSAFNGNKTIQSVTFGEKSQLTSIGSYAFYNCSSLTSIEIPNSVTSIGDSAFYGCSSLTNIEIPDSVTSIGSYAFYGCSSLTNIVIPDSVTSIGGRVFSDCSGLTNIEIPDSVTSIGSYAFSGCSNLTSIKIPNGVTSIGWGTFDGCSSLVSIELPDSVTSIGYDAFYGCSSLTSINIPDSVTSIGNYAFSSCSSLTSINIPDSVTSIGNYAFSSCSSLTSIIIPDGVISIGNYAFQYCRSLTSIIIPDGVTSIGQYAFSGCGSLVSIEIPAGVTSIGTGAFAGCTKLNLSISNENGSFTIIDGVLYNKAVTQIVYVPDSVSSIVIPATVTNISSAFKGNETIQSVSFETNSQLTSIGYDAFYNCSSLTSIEIPAGVTSIGSQAFYYCSGLTSIEIPESVTSIGSQAFLGCSSLVSIELPASVTSIGSQAFWGCSSLVSIEIPDSVPSIGDCAFYNCSSLYQVINNSDLVLSIGSSDNGYVAYYAKVIIDKNGNKTYKDGTTDLTYIDTAEGFRFMVENGEYKLISYLGSKDTVTLPENINGNTYTIYQMRGVKNVIIPAGVTSIGSYAFDGCSSLTSVTFGENSQLTSIEYMAFYGCSSLTSIEIPAGVTSIGSDAFHICSSLTSIEIPAGVTSIGNQAFWGCSSLVSIEIPDSVTSIGGGAFYYCSSLTNIEIPDSVTSIGGDAFYNTAYYNDLSNWVDGCLYIGYALIRVDTSAKLINLREGTTCIASGAFDECYSLTQVTLGGNHPLLLSSLTNLETLILTEMPTNYIYNYFGHSTSSIPITLSTIIIKEGAEVTSRYAFYGITGVTIYVEANEIDCPWDEVLPGWNNGNKVYYGGKWITADFYDTDGALIDSSVYLTSQVVRQPYYATTYDDYYTYTVGWDLDGDGIADTVPATSGSNITAYAVVTATERQYTVNFYDKDGVTVLYAYILGYGDTIPVPETPEKQGYTFLGWQGYENGMTVTGNAAIYSVWEHNGEHNYIKTTVAPTCTEEGYDLYVCKICNESYKENFVEPLGHSFGEWIVEIAATCTEDGLRYRVCVNCNETEYEVIEAIGHSYIGVITKEPTCTEYGEITYTCEHCGDVIVEQLDMLPHNYVKKTISKTWLQWLVERLLNIFFGYEGDKGYYYECADCHHIQTMEESMLLSASVQDANDHEHVLGDWALIKEPTCDEPGLYGRYCETDGLLIDARTIDALGHTPAEAVIENRVEATCTTTGSYETVIYCETCGEELSRETTEIPATGHTPAEAVIENRVEATCTTAGSYETVIYCETCGEELSRETTEIPMLDHSYGEVQTVEATCTEGGYTYRVCENCGYEEILSTTEALGHTPAEAVIENRVEATCTTAGSYETVIYCETCGEELSRETTEIPMLDHSYGEVQTVEATCTEGGYTYRVCENCGYEEILSTTEALGHTPAEAVIENRVEATCTTAGSYETVIYCSTCGEELSRETTITEATGHSYDTSNIQWTWADDFSSATATLVCLNDSSHTNTLTATIMSTTTEDGNIVYTATVSLDGITYTDQKTKRIPATDEANEGEGGEYSGNYGSGCGGGTGCGSTTMNEAFGAVTMLFIVIAAHISVRAVKRKK